ncbi:MAG: glycosyltransferase family 39 protein [Candidatus Bathyarchaeota archaeon]|nr:glycosyltransferase family 39 protein [Candidatus Bathyarchaeota archaeon]
MENQSAPNPPNESRVDLTVPLMIVTFLACAWLVYVFINQNWLDALDQVSAWMLKPQVTYTPVAIVGVPWALLATLEVLALGLLWGQLLLGNEKDFVLKLVASVGLGFGLTGLVTIILGIAGNLYAAPLNLAILLAGAVSAAALLYRRRRQKLPLIPHFALRLQFKLPPNPKFWLPAALAVAAIFFLVFYHALLTAVVHWDATVYHAAVATMTYRDHALPVLAGPSIGIQMSANFPPLFPALGAFYYTQIGAVEDFYLRAIPPVMGLLAVAATYKIGEVLHGRKLGLLAALFLALTPLFFRYSIYATSYSTLTFFCTMAVLFVLLGIFRGNMKYWVASGVFLGFAALTSYIALYMAPFFLFALVYQFLKHRSLFKLNMKKTAVFLFAVLLVGGVWYARNAVVVGNPIYPNAYTVLGGVNIDPLIMNTTVNGIKNSAANSVFGEVNATAFDQVMTFLTYRTSFPAISLFTLLAVALLPTMNKKFWLLAIWPLSLSALVLSGISWGFPHHLVFAMPGFALLTALPIIKTLDMCKQWDSQAAEKRFRVVKHRLLSLRKSNIIRLGLVAVLLSAFIFPSLTLVMGGKVYEEDHNNEVPADYLWLLKHPNADTWTVLNRLFPQVQAWEYINANVSAGQKVATIENQLYYVKNCSNDYFFYLDSWEARDLYHITDPELMLQFLRKNNVTIVVDVEWARDHFSILPMTKYLGSSLYFPTIFSNNSNLAIYNVGPFDSPITNNSKTTISINQHGWSVPRAISGIQTQSVLANNDSARLFVATRDLTTVKITYLDVGKDALYVNIFNPDSLLWSELVSIQKTNTGNWKTYEFLVPLSRIGLVELGLYAFNQDFVVSKIEASPYATVKERTAVAYTNSTLNMSLTNLTIPNSLFIYLPEIAQNNTLQLVTNTYGKSMVIEVFEGLIQPSETTGWWINHGLAIRSPNSTAFEVINPTLNWNVTKPDYYTVILVFREPWDNNAKVDISINMVVGPNQKFVTYKGLGEYGQP